ncbi:MAG: hypothetical protein F2667_04395 [Actinobacteria bacterium]|nr:hypothetical protein [Actinomycetota bacterium]
MTENDQQQNEHDETTTEGPTDVGDRESTNAMPVRRKEPSDRKKPADAPFTFEATVATKDGTGTRVKTFRLPKLDEVAAAAVPGRFTYDAIMQPDNEMAQMTLGFASLEACKPDPAALAALRSLPTAEMIAVVGAWLGESRRSSV